MRILCALALLGASVSFCQIDPTPGPWIRQNGTLQPRNSTDTIYIGTSVIDTIMGISDPIPALLQKSRVALAKVRNGSADMKVLAFGDSTTAGNGSSTAGTLPQSSAWPNRLVALLNARGIPAAPGLSVPNAGTDNRWSVGAGWAGAGEGFGLCGRSLKGTAPAGNIVFTPGGGWTYDKFDVYYVQYSGGGTITATATGGTPVVQNTSGSSALVKITAIAASAGTGNAVTISATGATVWFWGVEPYLSTTTKVRVGNAGVPSVPSSAWSDASSAWASIASIGAYGADLAIGSLGLNDAKTPISSAQFRTNMSAIITAFQSAGDVILWTPPGSTAGSGVPPAIVSSYVAVDYPFLSKNILGPGRGYLDSMGRTVSIRAAKC